MNSKLLEQITSFIESVGYYLKHEYDPVYYEKFVETEVKCKNGLFDFIGSYYMGGSTVPETARYVVDFINIRFD